MNRLIISLSIILFGLLNIYAEDFDTWFSSGTMRVDYILAGDKKNTQVFLSKIIHEPFWGGSRNKLIDTFEYGDYIFEIRNADSGKLLYSRGFCTLFREWQTTSEAENYYKAFPNSLRFPYPVSTVNLDIFIRRSNHSLDKIFSISIDPENPQIEKINSCKYKYSVLQEYGSPDKMIDIAIIAEGYTKKEMKKFRKDAKDIMEYFFSVEPFSTFKNRFNVSLIHSHSLESGTDIPGEGVWRSTIADSRFHTFGSERYLTTSEYWKINDIVACVPYDQILILVNSDKYGGGGIFNSYSITSSNNPATPGVLVHEFGHSFAGLGDEYYTSDVAYEGFYNLNYEPWEPNLTTLKEFRKKWEDMVLPGIPVPTPNEDKYSDVTGVFEGGGYVARGIFRPEINCRMKSNSADEFCRVCKRAIENMIRFYSE